MKKSERKREKKERKKKKIRRGEDKEITIDIKESK